MAMEKVKKKETESHVLVEFERKFSKSTTFLLLCITTS